FQDYTAEAVSDGEVIRLMNEHLAGAAAHYNLYLPSGKKIKDKFRCRAEVLRNATKILAPVNILESKTQVIQQFYMKFAKSLYKWDLAQYFTPHEVIDFIVEMSNPKPGEHVYDPACGSADFLISSYRRAGTHSDPCVWGADNSEQAVQISILNMVMNGDGKTQIKNEDSLETYTSRSEKYSIVLCNPPFGTKIVERLFEVLRKFDMGHKWQRIGDSLLDKTDVVRAAQQSGILFAELCVRLAKPSGRVGIILPNGYLGNRGVEYVALREWLLRHARLVAIAAFPRFTFKKSGADVSASVVLLERRKTPLTHASESRDYSFFVGIIESVGWRVGDKKAVPVYVRDQHNGDLILDTENEPILDADFAKILSEFLHSPAADCFPWTIEDRDIARGPQTQGIDIEHIVRRADLNLDPKRHSAKFLSNCRAIEKLEHFRLGDVLEVVPTDRPKIIPAKVYKYVEIELIRTGDFDYTETRGWQLPSRAKLLAKPGDIFIPHVWGCAGKWFVAAGDCEDIIVTNGCTRLRLKKDKEEILPHLVVGLCSELFSIQMRGFATGSDGLAEVVDDDLLSIILPKILDSSAEEMMAQHIEPMLAGVASFSKFAQGILKSMPEFPAPPPRKSHWALV
ncbi:MAG: HsdM family class I SAM-dependent methyltransferase, partial [Methylocella sp.]